MLSTVARRISVEINSKETSLTIEFKEPAADLGAIIPLRVVQNNDAILGQEFERQFCALPPLKTIYHDEVKLFYTKQPLRIRNIISHMVYNYIGWFIFHQNCEPRFV